MFFTDENGDGVCLFAALHFVCLQILLMLSLCFFFFFCWVWYRKDYLKGHGGVAAHYTLQIASVNASFLNTFRREIDAFLRQFGLNSMIPILGLKFDGSLWLKDC